MGPPGLSLPQDLLWAGLVLLLWLKTPDLPPAQWASCWRTGPGRMRNQATQWPWKGARSDPAKIVGEQREQEEKSTHTSAF